jgi:lysyl-tRNA synthetase class 2
MRVQKRYLDLIANKESRDVFVTRSKIIKEIRNYLDTKDFMEVSTPILSSMSGGASAKPFITHHNDLDQEMFMRVAPELFLKKLVIGGLDRVYEIGPQFRNENIDTTHSSEFTSLEFYMVYADYNDLMNMCEEMLPQIVNNINGKLQIEYNVTDEKQVTIDFTPPFKRIDMIPELEKHLGKLPYNLSTDQSRNLLDKLCQDNSVECAHPRTTGRLLDKLVGHFIEPICINPTFIVNHPVVMSPLAKQHRANSQLTERFELFVNGMEISNAFTELNSYTIQEERFDQQQKDKQSGDVEAMPKNDDFIEALKYGLPPTAGYGMGIDRLVMILTNKISIRDVILFPTVVNTKKD